MRHAAHRRHVHGARHVARHVVRDDAYHVAHRAVRAFARRTRAVAMVEAAIVLPLLFLFLFGIVDVGRAVFLSTTLQDTARRAARLAAVQGANPCATAQAQVKDSVAVWVREFNANPQSASTVRGLVTLACDVVTVSGTTMATNVKVTIANYPFATITPLPGLSGAASSWTMTRSAYARSESAPSGS